MFSLVIMYLNDVSFFLSERTSDRKSVENKKQIHVITDSGYSGCHADISLCCKQFISDRITVKLKDNLSNSSLCVGRRTLNERRAIKSFFLTLAEAKVAVKSKMAATVVRSLGSSLSKSLREVRVHLCQTSAGSRGARDFVEHHYVPLKKSNPDFPILIRECSGAQARLWARYEFGKECSVSVENMSSDQVAQALRTLVQSAP